MIQRLNRIAEGVVNAIVVILMLFLAYHIGFVYGFQAGQNAAPFHPTVQTRQMFHRIHHTFAVATAYCDNGRTASGMWTGPGVVAIDPNVIRLGTEVYLNNHRYLAADTGGVIRWHRHPRSQYADVDIWMASCTEATNWGRRVVSFDQYAKG